MTAKVDLYGLDATALAAQLQEWGQPAYRAEQIRRWLYERGVTDPAEMTDLPKALRERLDTDATVGTLAVVSEQVSGDGTRKRLYRLPGGQLVESVLMPYADRRRTACISSQAGCAMGCVFCATGQMGFARHLSPGEIFEQAACFAAELSAVGERLSNVVLMGMGEPFHNYDAVLITIRRLMTDLGIGARHITVSTVGLVPQIRRFTQEGLQVTLAISLHAATDEERSALLPVNRRWPIAELLDACRDYAEVTGRRVTFEWALIAGKNDGEEEAHRLGRLLRGLRCHVNLIPLNPTGGYGGAPSGRDASERFVQVLAGHGVPGTVRVRRGIDIDAGCGQLKSKVVAARRTSR
ncbi:MAG: 23S rRNA (adenine2503-C2)-methyltransferase [Myxococcota bacterium]